MSDRSLEEAHQESNTLRNRYGYHPPSLSYSPPLPIALLWRNVATLGSISLILSDALTLLQPDLNGRFQSSTEGRQDVPNYHDSIYRLTSIDEASRTLKQNAGHFHLRMLTIHCKDAIIRFRRLQT